MGLAEDIVRFEQNLEELIIKYEQYFLGLEKRAPLKLLDDVEKCVRRYAGTNIVNTMLKFKYNSIVARFNSYKQYWNRINTQIEEGRYSRERFKMEMKSIHKPTRSPQPHAEEQRHVPSEIDKVYQQYITARKACNLSTGNITPEIINTIIAQQKPAISKKYRCDTMEYKVVIEEGVPKIKVRPRK